MYITLAWIHSLALVIALLSGGGLLALFLYGKATPGSVPRLLFALAAYFCLLAIIGILLTAILTATSLATE